jgi:hypothetical protein
MDRPPAFLITIDTEGDNAWSRPAPGTTNNSKFLHRFQVLCERFGFRPTYLVNNEMAQCPVFQELASDALRRDTCEVGMHLHAWDSPPVVPLTADDARHHPYLIEYPHAVMRAKVHHMTTLLQETFGRHPTSHRAGRWAFNEAYAALLIEYGYRVDCSVTPHVSWTRKKGDPAGGGGSDYRGFPDDAYYLDARDIRRPGTSALLEVPVTIVRSRHPFARLAPRVSRPRLLRRALHQWPPVLWLRPRGRNRGTMLAVLRTALSQRRSYVEFMLHSSELMPGGSPTFASERDIERLYEDMEAVFAAASDFEGLTLTRFADRYAARYVGANGGRPS